MEKKNIIISLSILSVAIVFKLPISFYSHFHNQYKFHNDNRCQREEQPQNI